MSCNLDHALYGVQNLPIEEKVDYADGFYERFWNKEQSFIIFLNDHVVNGVEGESNAQTWKYIEQDLHSLERHTNFHIYFKMHPYYAT